MKDLHGKRILITGASTGIGKSTAVLLGRRGAELILVSKNRDRLNEVAKEISQRYPSVRTPQIKCCDVSNYMEVKQMISYFSHKAQTIDILINNAGLGVFGPFESHSIEDIERQMKVNFLGAVYCMHEVIPMMKQKGGGLIVNVGSIASFHGIPFIGAYCASKAALTSISQSSRVELKKDNIDIKMIFPGYTNTAFFTNEKIVGNTRRHKMKMMPVETVAEGIYQLIVDTNNSNVLSLLGWQLYWLNRIWPSWLDRLLEQYARRLRQNCYALS